MKTITILLLLTFPVFAKTEPAKFTKTKAAYKKALSDLETQHALKVKKLREKYISALIKIQKAETGKENLDGALIVREEIKQIKNAIAPKVQVKEKQEPKKEQIVTRNIEDLFGSEWLVYHKKKGGKDFGKQSVKKATLTEKTLHGFGKFVKTGRYEFSVNGWAIGKFSKDFKSFELDWGNSGVYKGILVEKAK